MTYLDEFSKQKTLIKALGRDQAHTAWVMAKYLEDPDVEALASVALTDGPDDKKIDFIYLDQDGRRIIFCQGYYSSKKKDTAPANKASDLNTAAAWLLSAKIKTVPEAIRNIVEDCRSAIQEEEVELIELFYVHNLPESISVARELQTVEEHIRKSMSKFGIVVRATELGSTRIQHLSDSQASHIAVKDSIQFPSKFVFTEIGPKWTAYVTSVSGEWLHAQMQSHGDDLFSANYRGFLGSGRRRKVNSGIRETAEAHPSDFWAFNNGITILTMGVTKEGAKNPVLRGMSIINGAQTTGSLGAVDATKKSLEKVRVLCRVIECSDAETIADIVRYNNTQNAITSWDQYSNDPDQKRIAEEFSEIGFGYSIKRGFVGGGEDQLTIDEVIQPLLSFHGRPRDATRGKNQIFDRKPSYQNAFDGKKSRHILLVYALARAIDEKRILLKTKSNENELIEVESKQLMLMRNLRFKPFFIALAAATLETIIGKKCDPLTVAFSTEAAKKSTLSELSANWLPIVETVLALITSLPDILDFGAQLSDDTFIPETAKKVNALLHAMDASSRHKAFSALVAIS